MNIEIVIKNETNAKLIMEWRNDEITRKMSFNSNLKIWELFENEFYNNYFNNIVPPLFATLNGIKVGNWIF
jgi:hypothetical protein